MLKWFVTGDMKVKKSVALPAVPRCRADIILQNSLNLLGTKPSQHRHRLTRSQATGLLKENMAPRRSRRRTTVSRRLFDSVSVLLLVADHFQTDGAKGTPKVHKWEICHLLAVPAALGKQSAAGCTPAVVPPAALKNCS